MRLYHNGDPYLELVDDYLPVSGDDGQSLINASVSQNGAWWLPILEKAYAKMNVNYA